MNPLLGRIKNDEMNKWLSCRFATWLFFGKSKYTVNETEKQYILNKNMQPGYIPRESLDNFWAFAPQLWLVPNHPPVLIAKGGASDWNSRLCWGGVWNCQKQNTFKYCERYGFLISYILIDTPPTNSEQNEETRVNISVLTFLNLGPSCSKIPFLPHHSFYLLILSEICEELHYSITSNWQCGHQECFSVCEVHLLTNIRA